MSTAHGTLAPADPKTCADSLSLPPRRASLQPTMPLTLSLDGSLPPLACSKNRPNLCQTHTYTPRDKRTHISFSHTHLQQHGCPHAVRVGLLKEFRQGFRSQHGFPRSCCCDVCRMTAVEMSSVKMSVTWVLLYQMWLLGKRRIPSSILSCTHHTRRRFLLPLERAETNSALQQRGSATTGARRCATYPSIHYLIIF